MENEGIIYFFRHNKIDAVKIGLTNSDNIIRRFTVFKTYSPFGAECIGVIRTNNFISLEKEIHKKLKESRINSKNEWFSISKENAIKIINEYGGEMFIPTRITKKPLIDGIEHFNKKTAIIEMYKSNYSRREISDTLNTQYSYVSKILNEYDSAFSYKRVI
jgi:hypothetical protein